MAFTKTCMIHIFDFFITLGKFRLFLNRERAFHLFFPQGINLIFIFFLCLLIFFFLLFFSPLTRPPKAKEWQPLPILASFGCCFGRNQPYRHVSVAVSAESIPVSTGIGPFWPKSAQIWLSRHESKKEKEKRESRQVGCRTPHRAASDSGAATLELHRCFLAYYCRNRLQP